MSVGTRADSLEFTIGGTELEFLAIVGAVPGVWVTHVAAKNGAGSGRLRTWGDGSEISWQAPGSSSAGRRKFIDQDAEYLLTDGDDPGKFIRIQVKPSFLASGPTASRVYLSRLFGSGVADDDVTSAEASAGITETYQITFENKSNAMVNNLVFWIDAATDDLEISDDGAAWVSPTTEATGLAFPQLAQGATDILHVRRTIGAASASDAGVLNDLHCRFDGI